MLLGRAWVAVESFQRLTSLEVSLEVALLALPTPSAAHTSVAANHGWSSIRTQRRSKPLKLKVDTVAGAAEAGATKCFNVALTETARLAMSINGRHREVMRLGRTAKEIAAEIGEE